MNLRSTLNCTIFFVLWIAVTGCASSGTPSATPEPQSVTAQPPAAETAIPTSAVGKPYDYYLLTLSWSPEYCATNPGSPECASHPGFVVHGLWPENNDGSYPKNCGTRPGPTSDAVWQGVLPTKALALHEWQTHGVCTPYDADTYFGLIRKAYGEVKIPPTFTHTTTQTNETPAAIISQFATVNTGFPAGSIAVSCGSNVLTAIEICFDKNLKAITCQGVKSCRANSVKIPPQ